MDTQEHHPARVRKSRVPTLKEQFAQSATGAALARFNQDLNELDRLAQGEDPPDPEP